MIFLAGSLAMNGGSTFLIRVARRLFEQGEPVAVVVLSSVVDLEVYNELRCYSEITMLGELMHPLVSFVGTSQLSIFLPNRVRRVRELLARHGSAVHVMGIFGLILASRWRNLDPQIKISAGIYHQNEYLFEGPRFFTTSVRELFRDLAPRNLVFFNEYNRATYSKFFGQDYSRSGLLPIGVVIPEDQSLERKFKPGLIVSVGNLVAFKTYNEHMIRVVAELRRSFPHLHYEIYGDGDNGDMLKALAINLGVAEAVSFKGMIAYSRFAEVVGQAHAFIGSGTALIEAAAMRVPSIVGIESIGEPHTYGYISNVPGLSYNEIIKDMPMIPIKELIAGLVASSEAEIAGIGKLCREKAVEFSIDRTVEGLADIACASATLAKGKSAGFWLVLFASFVKLAIFDRLGLDRSLRFRRNQSTDI